MNGLTEQVLWSPLLLCLQLVPTTILPALPQTGIMLLSWVSRLLPVSVILVYSTLGLC